MFTENRNIKMKHKIDGKINLYSRSIDCDFKRFEGIDVEELSSFLKSLI